MVGAVSAYGMGNSASFYASYVPGSFGKNVKEPAVTLEQEDPKLKNDTNENGRIDPSECETCKNRKYQDGSDENVSFKSAAHISPQAAGAAVRAHEGEHVANAYSKAAESGGHVISCGVTIKTDVCPECGRTYVAGGTTRSVTKTPTEAANAYKANQATKAQGADGNNLNLAV